MWSKAINSIYSIDKKISIQHLYMWSNLALLRACLCTLFQYNICTCGALQEKLDAYYNRWFQYNICTCGALSPTPRLHRHHDFNTTFVHVELEVLFDKLTTFILFQYNICTCGAISKNFRTFINTNISIQHLYMWSVVVYGFCCVYRNFNTTFVHVELKQGYVEKDLAYDFNTTFVHVEHTWCCIYKCVCGISIQHLYMWSISDSKHQNKIGNNFNTTFVHVEQFVLWTSGSKEINISIQHLYMWSTLLRIIWIRFVTISIQHLYMWSSISPIHSDIQAYFNTTFVHVERFITLFISYFHFYFNTTFVHVEHGLRLVRAVQVMYFNTTFVHVEHCKMFSKYNPSTISIQHLYMWSCNSGVKLSSALNYFNTTFVHVERWSLVFN